MQGVCGEVLGALQLVAGAACSNIMTAQAECAQNAAALSPSKVLF